MELGGILLPYGHSLVEGCHHPGKQEMVVVGNPPGTSHRQEMVVVAGDPAGTRARQEMVVAGNPAGTRPRQV